MPRRRGRRGRERRARRVVLRAEWWLGGRRAVVVEVTRRGEVWVTVPGDARRVGPAGREQAADWLGEYLPRLTHDERYAALWE